MFKGEALSVQGDRAVRVDPDVLIYHPGPVLAGRWGDPVTRCEHCYASHTLGKTETMTADQLLRIARDFQKIGVGVLAWEGGEPLLRFDDLLCFRSQVLRHGGGPRRNVNPRAGPYKRR